MVKRPFGSRSVSISYMFAMLVFGLVTPQASAGGLPCRYDVADIIYGPTSESLVRAEALNDHDDVAGWYRLNGLGNNRAFYWTRKGGFVTIPMPAGILDSKAWDISNSGLVVGVMESLTNHKGFIFNIHTGQMTTLFTEHGQGQCEVTGVNEAGVVCGFRSVNNGGDPWVPLTAFRWSVQTGYADMTPTGSSQAADINESGAVAGAWYPAGVTHAFRWRADGTIDDLPTLAGMESRGLAIGNDHEVVGISTVRFAGFVNGVPRAASWVVGEVSNLGTLVGFPFSYAIDLNNSRTTVGYVRAQTTADRATVRQAGALRDLNSLTSFAGHLESAWGINSSGNIVAWAGIDANFQSVSVILVPQRPIVGDVNGTCNVNVQDLLVVIGQWGEDGSATADLDNSGLVDMGDLLLVIVNWTF